MSVHQSARLTARRRQGLVRRLEAGEPLTRITRQLDISVRTARKWWGRYRAEGLTGLIDRSSRSHVSPPVPPRCNWPPKSCADNTGPAPRSPRSGSASRPRLAPGSSRTRPHTTRTNGKAERFIQTLLREWAYARLCYTSADRARVLPGPGPMRVSTGGHP